MQCLRKSIDDQDDTILCETFISGITGFDLLSMGRAAHVTGIAKMQCDLYMALGTHQVF